MGFLKNTCGEGFFVDGLGPVLTSNSDSSLKITPDRSSRTSVNKVFMQKKKDAMCFSVRLIAAKPLRLAAPAGGSLRSLRALRFRSAPVRMARLGTLAPATTDFFPRAGPFGHLSSFPQQLLSPPRAELRSLNAALLF